MHRSRVLHKITRAFHTRVSNVVVKENKDVSSMDRLLKVVRARSDPTYHNVLPLITHIPWSETLRTLASGPDDAIPLTTPRHMHDSYSESILPFGSSPELLEQYILASGGIRTGKLMEHLDSLAEAIAYKHMLGPDVLALGRIQERGYYIVTASVDRLDMMSPLDPARDLRLSGQVIYTGHSSMEVAVKIESIGMGQPEETVLIGRFSMVCRNADTHRAREVNPLIVSTDEEQELYTLGEQIKKQRQSLALQSLSSVPPSSSEVSELHALHLKYGQEQENAGHDTTTTELVWMGDTVLDMCMLMFPQERNVHQKIFGGYLMRLAYELGVTNASLFARGTVKFLSLDGISFARPVPIGSILRLRSQILHTTSSPQYNIIVHVGVQANVVDVKTGCERTTNNFRFTWCQEPLTSSTSISASALITPSLVVPKTYKETMLWLEGKRALEIGAEIRESRKE